MPRKLTSTKWRTVDEDDDPDPADDSDAPPPPPSSYQYRPRKGTVASSQSESMSGLTSASEDETDTDDYVNLREGDEDPEEERTAAIVVAEEGRGLIVHGEGQNVTAVNIQPGMLRDRLTSWPLNMCTVRHDSLAPRFSGYAQFLACVAHTDITQHFKYPACS